MADRIFTHALGSRVATNRFAKDLVVAFEIVSRPELPASQAAPLQKPVLQWDVSHDVMNLLWRNLSDLCQLSLTPFTLSWAVHAPHSNRWRGNARLATHYRRSRLQRFAYRLNGAIPTVERRELIKPMAALRRRTTLGFS